MIPDARTKTGVLAALRAQIAADLEALTRSQADSSAGATHAESRPEHAKDTRSVEASYLARGLAERVVTLRTAAEVLERFELRPFGSGDAAALSALVCIETQDAPPAEAETTVYFLAPAGGGVKVVLDGEMVHVVTPRSPVGAALMGSAQDDEITYRTPAGPRDALIRWLV